MRSQWDCVWNSKKGLRYVIALALPLIAVPMVSLSFAADPEPQAEDFLIVDCLLPGQVRKLGSMTTYVTARRPIRTSAVDCEIRGGEYVAYDRADYRTALSVWLPMAKEGNPEAMTNVGEIYEKGLGVHPDYEAAAHWYRQAADKKFMRAQINLGYLYEVGLGVERDPREALIWYRKASGLESEIDLTPAAVPPRPQESGNDALIQQLQSELAKLETESHGLRSELARAEAILSERTESTPASSPSRPATQAGTKPQSDAELVTVHARLNQREQELQELDRLLNQTRVELKAAEAELAVKEQVAADLSAQLSDTTAALSERERELAARAEELRRLASELALQRDKEAAEVAEESLALETLSRDLDSKSSEQAAELARQREALAARESELAKLDELVAKRDEELRQTNQALAGTRSELDQYRQQYAASEQDRGKAEQEAAINRQQLAQRTAELRTLEKELEQQRAAAQAKNQQVAQMQARIQDLEAANKRHQQAEKIRDEAIQDRLLAGPDLTLIDPIVSHSRSVTPLVLRSSVDTRQVVGMAIAPAGLLSLTVNDEPVEPNAQGVFSHRITLYRALNPVSIVAIDNQGKRENLAFNFSYERSQAAQPAAGTPRKTQDVEQVDIDFGKYYALIIGNNDYETMIDLRTPINDAQQMAEVLETRYGVDTTVLLDANRYQILSALNDLRAKLTSKDNLLIYYAGHGVLDEVNMRGHWLPVDAEAENTANWISNVSITDMLNVIRAKQILVISDSCYSGSLTRSTSPRLEGAKTEVERYNWLKTMVTKKARMVLTSGGLQPVLDSAGGNHSVFAKALINVLESNNDILEGRRLYREVSARVAYSAAQVGFDQVPEYSPIRFAGHESGEFFLVPRS